MGFSENMYFNTTTLRKMNLEDNFIPYEEAAALKSLGFNWKCFGGWREYTGGGIELVLETHMVQTKAPIYQQVFEWFRVEHELESYITDNVSLPDFEYMYKIHNKSNGRSYGGVSTTDHRKAELECVRKLINLTNN